MRMRCTEATSRLVNQVEMYHHLRGSSNPKRSNCNTCEDTHCVMAVQRLSAVAVQAKQGLEKQGERNLDMQYMHDWEDATYGKVKLRHHR